MTYRSLIFKISFWLIHEVVSWQLSFSKSEVLFKKSRFYSESRKLVATTGGEGPLVREICLLLSDGKALAARQSS